MPLGSEENEEQKQRAWQGVGNSMFTYLSQGKLSYDSDRASLR